MTARLFSALICLGLAACYPFYKERIPNGNNVPNPCDRTSVWEGVGHRNQAGGGVRNPFGEDFAVAGRQWTAELCKKDSDQDGRSNGEELGDPNCQWTAGAASPVGMNLTHPGICEPVGSTHCLGVQNFTCSGPPAGFNCPAIQEPGVETFELKFPRMQVPTDVTNYFCQIFEVPSDRPYHAVAFQPMVDNINVLHHMVVYGCRSDDLQPGDPVRCGMTMPECRDLIALWSIGLNGYCPRENVGVPFGAGSYKYLAIQLHWNNPQRSPDYYDQSGILMHYTAQTRHFSEQMGTVGQLRITIPPMTSDVTVTGHCRSSCTETIGKSLNITSAFLHMHYLGDGGKMLQYRNGEYLRTILDDSYYNYDTPIQHIFDEPLDFLPGDEIMTSCKYNSRDGSRRRDSYTYFGDATEDEMCFVFFTYYSADPEDPDVENYFCGNVGPSRLICRVGMPNSLSTM